MTTGGTDTSRRATLLPPACRRGGWGLGGSGFGARCACSRGQIGLVITARPVHFGQLQPGAGSSCLPSSLPSWPHPSSCLPCGWQNSPGAAKHILRTEYILHRILSWRSLSWLLGTLAGGSTFPVAVAQLISPFDDAAKEDKIQGSFPRTDFVQCTTTHLRRFRPSPYSFPPLHHHLEQGSSGRNLTSCSGPRGRGFAVDLVPLPASRRTACNRLCCTPYIDFLLFCLLDARGTMQTPVSPSQQATKNRRRPGPQPCTPGVLQARLSMPRSAASMVVHYWEAAATAEALAAARHRDTNETGTIKGRKGTNGCIQTSSRPLPAP
ncbi:hypothetical protein Purlil1_3950 [Purpureocillium lilacinum]|uniref:Uncharacterized protein n=1 Tax=Purpureocillium lilacinum TaxID=33203 RepID=A0ABR0C5M2_PURLI|nr:hypothetical protein Purlil1_3950 [Purpureocillium lilacinum]